MMVREFQDRLLRTFPEQTWSSLVQAIADGIRKADEHIRDTPMLAGEVGSDLRGHVRRVSILHRFQELGRSRHLPYEASPSKMPVGSWHWLNIRSGGTIAHVVRTETPEGRPDDTKNRQAMCVTNQYDLLRDGTIPPVELIITRARYALLTFGVDLSGGLTHVSLGMPSADNSHWLAFAKLLRRSKLQPEPLIVPPPAPQSAPVATQLKFVPEVAQMLDERDEKSTDEKSA